ncbi:DEAD box RNA helicase [Actinidia rufa]|uniref:DEAD box RNA helicase n=1 Tax=Actinidia rufa TaxID=165716 RepID=A0A7J0E9T1_9ERIC|nr:DEAD box RNA helicase [Actinidia rufa]
MIQGGRNISKIERESGVKFEHISVPQLAEIAKAAGSAAAAETITQVSDGVIPIFKSADQELLNTSGLAPVELLAKALAKSVRLSLVCIMQGYIAIKSRLLLSFMENYATVLLESERPIYALS